MKSLTKTRIKTTVIVISVIGAIVSTHYFNEYKANTLGYKITTFMASNR